MPTLDTISTAYASVTTSWDAFTTTAWTKMRLVRSAAGTPRDERDGGVLFEDDFGTARSSYTDEGLTTGRYYYYGLFVLTADGWLNISSATFLVTKDWGYTSKLYQALPEVFRSDDYAVVTEPTLDPEQTFLYRFLSVFGFQLDALRTDTESMKGVLDATIANQALLPALSAQVGLTYEPEIGAQALRKLIANAIHLWSIKGTVPSVRELASVLTGYVTHVRIGRNLALDGLDAGPTTDKGRWRGLAGCTVTYRANAATDTNPAGDGVRVVTCAAPGVVSFGTNLGDADVVLRRQTAVPVLPGQQYTVSSYFRTTVAGVSVTPHIVWLTANGTVISDVSPAAVPVGAGWTRAVHVNNAPAAAGYLEVSYDTSALTVGQTVEHCGFQVEEGGAATDWECAREVGIYFDPQIVNYVGNTSGAAPSNYGWSASVEAAVDPTYGPYLVRYTPDPEDPNAIYPIDALAVTYPGDVIPPPPAPEDSLAPTEVYYTAGHEPVAAGQVWTALAEAIPPATDAPDVQRYGHIGFRLYDSAGTLVGHDTSEIGVLLVQGQFTPLVHELTVPAGAAYDHIEVCIITDGPCGFRHVALEPVNQYAAYFFDASSPSTTGDYLWGGTPFESPSYAYDRRSSRTVRLRALLLDFLPHGSCYDIFFATTPPNTPQSIAGVDPDPATSLPL